MSLLVRIVRGVWVKEENGEWYFKSDPSDLGFGVFVGVNESFASLLDMVKLRYQLSSLTPVVLTYQYPKWSDLPCGNKTPPMNITKDLHVTEFVHLRQTYKLLPIYVTSGAEAVASYEYICRTPSDGNNTATEPLVCQPMLLSPQQPNIGDSILSGDLVPTQRLVDEVFNDEEMFIIHHVHMDMMRTGNHVFGQPSEMFTAPSSLDMMITQTETPDAISPILPVLDTICDGVQVDVLDNAGCQLGSETDNEVVFGDSFIHTLSPNTNGLLLGYPNNMLCEVGSEADKDHIFGDLCLPLLTSTHVGSSSGYGLDDTMLFWTGVEHEGNAMNIDDGIEEVKQEDTKPVESTGAVTINPIESTAQAVDGDDDNSSTGSSGDVENQKNTDFALILEETMQLTPLELELIFCDDDPQIMTHPVLPEQVDAATAITKPLIIQTGLNLDDDDLVPQQHSATPIALPDISNNFDALPDDLDFPITLSQVAPRIAREPHLPPVPATAVDGDAAKSEVGQAPIGLPSTGTSGVSTKSDSVCEK